MTDTVFFAGVVSHLLLTVGVVYPQAQTRNPIWGELRSSLSGLVVLVVWVGLWSVTNG